MADLKKVFSNAGTQFIAEPEAIAAKLARVDTLLFDWDGVFNNGTKGHNATSHFTEADSMGVNMLRFSLWLRSGILPFCAIITGRQNQSAQFFAEREHFHEIYMGYTNKQEALNEGNINVSKAAFFFDDILDLSVARQSEIRLLISRDQSPLTTRTIIENNWCEMMTGATGGMHAVREGCEVLIGLNNNWNEVINSRIDYNDSYQKYLAERNAVDTIIHEKSR